ncbi:MAG: MATE family efflux transporter [Spirochaetaceae bacterium]|nr:MATE family efflux transporter [Spirochaetaceae bacterium]
MKNSSLDMTVGNPTALILKFSMPLFVGNLLQQCYNLVDSIVVGKFIGKEALAAVGSSGIIVFLLVSLFSGVAMGATILISQFFGAKEHGKIKVVIDTMFSAMLVGSLIVTLGGIALSAPILRLMQTPEGEIFQMSTTYLYTLFAGVVASFGYNINAGILQGVGDSRTTLLFLAIATVVNIILDLLFVVVFDMGVFGVALATVIAQGVSFLFGVFYINRVHSLFRISFRKLSPDVHMLGKAISIGLPAGFQNALFSLGAIVLQRLVYKYGASFMAAYTAVNKIDTFVFLPVVSFSSAITTYVGQNVGAKNLDRVVSGVKQTLLLGLGVSVVLGGMVLLWGRFLLSMFTDDNMVIEYGMEFMYRLMPIYWLLATLMVTNSAIRGAGESVLPMVFSIMSMLVVRIPTAYILDYFFGQNEIFWCYGIGWVVGNSLALPYFFSGRWKKKSLLE